MLLTSSRLPAPHGFSTRHGGCSEGPYASLNLGGGVGDSPERVAVNLDRLAAAGGFPLSALATVSQVHGAKVLEAAAPPAPAPRISPSLGEADAVWTAAPGRPLGIRTADCVPILLADPEGHRVAAVHSGWRGTDARISARTVEALIAQGTRPGALAAAIGPSIRACCYVVSADLGTRFAAAFGPEVAFTRDGEWRLDLAVAVRDTLIAAGVPAEGIDLLPQCTACDPDTFFSHRRDQGVTGRHLSYVICDFPEGRAFS